MCGARDAWALIMNRSAARVRAMRLAFLVFVTFALLLALVTSCSSSAGQDDAVTDGAPNQDVGAGDGSASDGDPTGRDTGGAATIGPAGGTVTSPDGVVVTIPPGALDVDREITVAATAEAAPDGFAASSAIYRFEPSGLVFQVPITVAFPPPAHPGMVLWSDEGAGSGSFGVLESTLIGGKLTVHPSHFSRAFVGAVVFTMSTSGGQLTVSRVATRYQDGGVAATSADAGYLPALQLRYASGSVSESKTFTLVGSAGLDPAFDQYLFGKAPTVPGDKDRLGWYWDLEPRNVVFGAGVNVTMAVALPMPPSPNVIATSSDAEHWGNGQELGIEQYFPPYVGNGSPLLYGYAAPLTMSGFFTAVHECAVPLITEHWMCSCMDPANPGVSLPSGLLIDQSVTCHGQKYQLFGQWTVGGPRTSTLVETCSWGGGFMKTCTIVGTMKGCTCPTPNLTIEHTFEGDCGGSDAGASDVGDFIALCKW